MTETIKANLYRECSAKKLTGLADLFVSVSGLYTPLEKLEPDATKTGSVNLHDNSHKKDKCVVQ